MSAPWRARAALACAFSFGLATCAAVLLPWRYPAETYGVWARLRYGAEPSPAGLVLNLRLPEGPPPLSPSEGTPAWVEVEVRNVGEHPARFLLPEVVGEELRFEAEPSLPPRAPLARDHLAGSVESLVLPPGGRLAFALDLKRYLIFPAPGRYRVRCERLPFGDKALLRTGWLWVEVR